MSSFLGRNSRRRRVLNEEALSASSAHLAMRTGTADEPADTTVRYSEAAGVEHHPQVTDFMPRRYRTIGLLALVGVASTAAVEGLYWFATPALEKYGFEAAAAIDLTCSGGVAGWLAAVLSMLSAATCLLIYSLRRHRIDDFKGRYRIWLAAAAACALVSVESVAPVHRLVVAAAAYHTGWTALRGHAAWWLLLGGMPLGWIALRTWLDARESRLAAAALAAAGLAYGIAISSYLGLWTALEPRAEVMVTAGARLFGDWMLLVGLVSYGRFVVLDAQGLIPARQRKRTVVRQVKKLKADCSREMVSASASVVPASPLRAFRQGLSGGAKAAAVESKSTQWVDGSEPEDDGFDDDDGSHAGGRKLSRAERKRLRKLKARDQAA